MNTHSNFCQSRENKGTLFKLKLSIKYKVLAGVFRFSDSRTSPGPSLFELRSLGPSKATGQPLAGGVGNLEPLN